MAEETETEWQARWRAGLKARGWMSVRPIGTPLRELLIDGVPHVVPVYVEVEATLCDFDAPAEERRRAPRALIKVWFFDDDGPQVLNVAINSTTAVQQSALAWLPNLDTLADEVMRESARPIEAREAWIARDAEELAEADELMSRVLDPAERARTVELRRVAGVFLEHIDAQPTKAVAKLLNYSERTAARRIKAASEAGLLPPTTRGRKRRPDGAAES